MVTILFAGKKMTEEQEMAGDTRERILDKALEMFAENGYKGTNLRDLAESLNLSKSALYRHFDSKEDIWDALAARMEAYYESGMKSFSGIQEIPASPEDFTILVMDSVRFSVTDPAIVRMRKILASEQFHEESARVLATRHFLTGIRDTYTGLFSRMMDAGLLRKDDPGMLALCFTAPITVLVHQCDRDPGRIDEILGEIRGFVSRFLRVYWRG